MGQSVNKFIYENFNVNEQSIAFIDDIYTLNYESEEEEKEEEQEQEFE
jgi:hypothetical protein